VNDINRKNKTFAKKSTPQSSREVYQIYKRKNLRNPRKKIRYRLKMIRDADNNVVNIVGDKFYYRRDLLHIN